MSFYGDMQGIASSLLKEFDQGGLKLAVFTPGSGPAHNPGQPTYPETPFAGTARGVNAQHLADTLGQSSDLAVTMPGTLSPKMADRIVIGGAAHTIVKISAKPATGIVAAYEVRVRK